MAPVLFNIYACAAFERWSSGIENYGDVGLTLRFNLDKKLFRRASVCGAPLSVSNGQFADDAVLFSSTHVGAERMLQCFADVAADFGLSVSTTKTKFQVVGHDVTGADRAPLLLNGTEIPCVPEFRYLGSVMTPDGRSSTDIRQRIASASRAFGVLLKPFFRNKSLSIRTKRHIFTCCVTTVLLYSSELWTPLQKDLRRLEHFYHQCLAIIMDISCATRWSDRISNADLRQWWGSDSTVTLSPNGVAGACCSN